MLSRLCEKQNSHYNTFFQLDQEVQDEIRELGALFYPIHMGWRVISDPHNLREFQPAAKRSAKDERCTQLAMRMRIDQTGKEIERCLELHLERQQRREDLRREQERQLQLIQEEAAKQHQWRLERQRRRDERLQEAARRRYEEDMRRATHDKKFCCIMM